MSGGVCTVWGKARFQPPWPKYEVEAPGLDEETDEEDKPPPEPEEPEPPKRVTLKASDGETFELNAQLVATSRRISEELRERRDEDDVEISLPLSGTILAKIAEYFKYHADSPSNELRIPLPSDKLVECGAEKWDADFVNLKKDELFELMLAATLLQISSLVFLTNAKATLLVKNKEPNKIRKEFGLKNDFDPEEEEELNEKYVAALVKRGLDADTNNLHGMAGILAGLTTAAVENKVCESGLYGTDLTMEPALRATHISGASLTSYRHFCWHAAVLVDWPLLADAPDSVKGDRELILAAIGPSDGAAASFAADELRGDRQLFLRAAKYNPASLREASQELRSDRAFVAEAVAVNGAALACASDHIRGDREFVLGLVKQGHVSALEGAGEALLGDEGFILEALVEDAEAYRHAAEQLGSDRDFALRAVEVNGDALRHMNRILKADRDVVQKAAAQSPDAVAFAHVSRRAQLGMRMPWDNEEQYRVEAEERPLRQGYSELGGRGKKHKFNEQGPFFHAVPAETQDQPRSIFRQECEAYPRMMNLQKKVEFSAMNTMQANMGQTNYISANSFLDKLPFYWRPTIDSITLMWGPVGQIGMRQKAFASQDFLLMSPENLMDIYDASRILKATTTRMDPPEWYNPCFMDAGGREGMLKPTAGLVPGLETRSELFRRSSPTRDGLQLGGGPKSLVGDPEGGTPGSASSGAPLGGWPKLGGADSGGGSDQGKAVEVCEGARVRLQGLNNQMNGITGVVLKQFPPDGKWKVLLDGKMGKALLKAQFLEVIGAA